MWNFNRSISTLRAHFLQRGPMSETNQRTDLCKCETTSHSHGAQWQAVWSPNSGVESCESVVGGCIPLRACFTIHYINCGFHCPGKKNKTDLHSLLDCTLPSSKKISQQWQSIIRGMSIQRYILFISLPLCGLANHSSSHSPLPFAKCGSGKVWSTGDPW